MTLAQFFELQRSEHAIVLPERETVRGRAWARPAVSTGAAGERRDAGDVQELVRKIAALRRGAKTR